MGKTAGTKWEVGMHMALWVWSARGRKLTERDFLGLRCGGLAHPVGSGVLQGFRSESYSEGRLRESYSGACSFVRWKEVGPGRPVGRLAQHSEGSPSRAWPGSGNGFSTAGSLGHDESQRAGDNAGSRVKNNSKALTWMGVSR